jgi:hypothetical protein
MSRGPPVGSRRPAGFWYWHGRRTFGMSRGPPVGGRRPAGFWHWHGGRALDVPGRPRQTRPARLRAGRRIRCRRRNRGLRRWGWYRCRRRHWSRNWSWNWNRNRSRLHPVTADTDDHRFAPGVGTASSHGQLVDARLRVLQLQDGSDHRHRLIGQRDELVAGARSFGDHCDKGFGAGHGRKARVELAAQRPNSVGDELWGAGAGCVCPFGEASQVVRQDVERCLAGLHRNAVALRGSCGRGTPRRGDQQEEGEMARCHSPNAFLRVNRTRRATAWLPRSTCHRPRSGADATALFRP